LKSKDFSLSCYLRHTKVSQLSGLLTVAKDLDKVLNFKSYFSLFVVDLIVGSSFAIKYSQTGKSWFGGTNL